jgi:hypothetical protein
MLVVQQPDASWHTWSALVVVLVFVVLRLVKRFLLRDTTHALRSQVASEIKQLAAEMMDIDVRNEYARFIRHQRKLDAKKEELVKLNAAKREGPTLPQWFSIVQVCE